LAAAFIFLMAASGASPAAEAAEKRIPYKWIPRKRIPKQSRYFQAPAFRNRARRNRRLVTKARRSNRQLRRTGTAYEIGGR
jgi:hypothetical protein